MTQIKPTIRIIEPTIVAEKNDYNILKSTALKRVCAYCRVSTDLEEQETSFNSQKEYYQKMISEHEGWVLVDIYADEGITATSMRKRKNFLRMIDDAMAGKIDMILCKSISRFARNVVDCLSILEQLKMKGIPVIFETERLNSLDDERATRLRITIESASAQEYSENLSQSVSWGKRRRIEQGHYALHRIYGYDILRHKDKNINAEYIINERESEIVKYIFDCFLNGYSTYQIANKLNEQGIKSPIGKNWHQSTIMRMLKNETYTGDLLYQKTISTDLKSRRRIENTTQKKYLIENHHIAIIDKVRFERVAKEFEYRSSLRGYSETGKSIYTSIYPFSNKLYCLECGSKLRRHYYYAANKDKVYTWVCINHKVNGDKLCKQKQIKEEDLKASFVRVMNKLIENQDELIETVRGNIQSVIDQRICDNGIEKMDAQLRGYQNQITKLIAESVNDSTGKVFAESQRVMAEMGKLKAEKDAIIQERAQSGLANIKVIDLEEYLTKDRVFNEFNDIAFRKLVEKVVIKDNQATFIFNDMIKITDNI